MNVAAAARWTSRVRRSVARAIATVRPNSGSDCRQPRALRLPETQLSDVRIERVAARPDEYELDTTDFDVVPLSGEAAAPICARHDEIGTNRPVFVGQDKVKRYALSERERERRTGTPWYREWPQRLLHTEYHRWRTSRGIAK